VKFVLKKCSKYALATLRSSDLSFKIHSSQSQSYGIIFISLWYILLLKKKLVSQISDNFKIKIYGMLTKDVFPFLSHC
jgi:hypothetical protein